MLRIRYRFPAVMFILLLVPAGAVFFLSGSKAPDREVEGYRETVFPETLNLPALPAIADYNAFLTGELDSSGTVGAAYTVVYDGEIIETRTYGFRKAGSPERVDAHTVFRIASVSKGFAGLLACLLEKEGLYSLDDRVADHYPGFSLKDSMSTAGLNIRHLLSHTSGLVPYAFDNLVEEGQALESIVARLPEVDISAPPGELYGYQNVLFSMIDPILESITGEPYPALLQQRIFAPLGMNDASAGELDPALRRNVAYPHVRVRDGYTAGDLHRGYYNVMPAAGINASISDMGQWLVALLGNRPDVLPGEVTSELATPVIYTPLKARYTRQWQPFRERYYSLGWRIYRYRGREIIYHGGYVRGYRAEVGFCPEERVGIAFLQNSPNGVASKSVPAFFDLFFDDLEREIPSDTAVAVAVAVAGPGMDPSGDLQVLLNE